MRTVEDSLSGLHDSVQTLDIWVNALSRKTKKLRPSNTCCVAPNTEPTSGVAIVDAIDCVRLLVDRHVNNIRLIVEELAITVEEEYAKASS